MSYWWMYDWPKCTLLSEYSWLLLFCSLVLLAKWFFNAREGLISQTIGDGSFIFLRTHLRAFIAKIILVISIICVAISLYNLYMAMQILDETAYADNARRLNRALLDNAKELYTSYLITCQRCMNFSLFCLPLTIVPLWGDSYMDKRYKSRTMQSYMNALFQQETEVSPLSPQWAKLLDAISPQFSPPRPTAKIDNLILRIAKKTVDIIIAFMIIIASFVLWMGVVWLANEIG